MDKFGRSLSTTSTHRSVIQTPNVISVTQEGEYNVKEHRLVNVKTPVEDGDAVNKKYLDDTTFSVSQYLGSKLADTHLKLNEFRTSMDAISYSLTSRIDSVSANCEASDFLLRKAIENSKKTVLKEVKAKYSEIDDVKQLRVDLEMVKKDVTDVAELINKHFSDFEAALKILHRVDVDEINKKIKAITQEMESIAKVVYNKNPVQ